MYRSFLVGFVLLAVGCSAPPPEGLSAGSTAPDFTGNDVNGRTIRLSDYRGKVVVLDFWATWCPPCVAMVPETKTLAQRFEGRPFEIVGISADDSRGDLKSFIDERGMTWTQVFDGRSGPIAKEWKIPGWPTIIVIDAKGVIRHRDLKGKALENAVEALLAEAGSK